MIPIVGLDLSRETILLSSSGIRFRHFSDLRIAKTVSNNNVKHALVHRISFEYFWKYKRLLDSMLCGRII